MDESDTHILSTGHLAVDNGHNIFWQEWGNSEAKEPIIFLHGGPGSGCKEKHKHNFDPARHRVIFFDQRGAGQSTPFASRDSNTTPDLVADISKLADHLKIERFSLVGSSWGSTLALCYAIANPNRVVQMLLSGIFLARQKDLDFLYKGGAQHHFPEVWERFIANVPEEEQDDPIGHYYKHMQSDDEEEADQYIRSFVQFEASLLSLDRNPSSIRIDDTDDSYKALGLLEAHYFTNRCFIEENYILSNAEKIKHIPTTIIHGRYDFVCAPEAAYELKKHLPQASLHIVMGGHKSEGISNSEVFRAHIQRMFG